jgi:hypothetical protein
MPIKTKQFVLVALLLALLAIPASANARVPASFAGMAPQGDTTALDYELMSSSGIRSVRLPMFWASLQEQNRYLADPDFDGFDRQVKMAAEEGIRIFPFVYSTPGWVNPDHESLPVDSSWERWAWRIFLKDAVHRYGPEDDRPPANGDRAFRQLECRQARGRARPAAIRDP